MTRSVKVGDKVKSKVYGHGVIEDDGDKLVGARFDSGSYRVYRKDDWSSTLEDDSIEFIEPIKVGDTVTLIDKPWEHSLWAKLPRNYKKEYITTKGKTWSVERVYNGVDPLSGECAFPTGGSRYIIPLDLLRKVDDGINRHTPEQIAEAQRIIGEIVAGFTEGDYFYIRDESDKELSIRYTAETADGMHTITAHCSPHDEFNRTIGLLVALCKATGRKLPDWV